KIYLYDNDDNEFNVTKEATVLDNNIASVSFSFAQTPQVREYTDGYADYRYDVNDNKECFYYYNLPTVYSNGNKLTLKMKDESIKVYTYKNGGFYDSEDNELRAEIDTSSEQYSKHWSVGSNNEFTIECLGFSTTAKATVVSSGIKSVSFTPATPYVITENDSKYSEIETDEYGTKYIYYYSDAYDFYKEGNKFTVTFTNGSTTEYTCRKDNYGDLSYLDSNNKYMPYDYCRYNTQYKNHWTPSANNAFYVYLCGQTLAVPVTIAHAWSGWTVTSTATCTTAGSKYRTCSVCGAKDVVNEPAAGHKWKVTKVYKNATFKKAGSGKYKCTVCGATKKDKIPKLGKVNAKKVKVKAGKKQFTLSWTPVANIGGYQIQYSTSKKFGKGTKTVNVKGAKTSKKTIKKLGKKKTYYVRIRACKKIGKKVQYSAWTAAKKVKTK
ncbi:MAG: fibronectin type III domain-containing protein, partial [Eubacterium sp.]|nr:fibronectin type III domain-containing protein [Eubacterium sp.]